MQIMIEEMRHTISAQNLRSGHVELPSTCPDWAVKRIFEKRHGLPFSALPANVRTLKAGEVRNTELKRAADSVRKGIEADQAAAETSRLRLRASFLL